MVIFHKMLPNTQSLHSQDTQLSLSLSLKPFLNRSFMAPPQTIMAEPLRAHPPSVVVFFSSLYFYFQSIFLCMTESYMFVWLVMGLRI